MDSEQTRKVPLFLRRGNSENSSFSSHIVKKLVFPDEEVDGESTKAFRPQNKVGASPHLPTTPDIGLQSPSHMEKVFNIGMNSVDECLHPKQKLAKKLSTSGIGKGDRVEERTNNSSGIAIPSMFSETYQNGTPQRNKESKRISFTPEGFNGSSPKLDHFVENNSGREDERTTVDNSTSRPSLTLKKNASSFNVFRYGSFLCWLCSDSDSSTNSNSSGFFSSPSCPYGSRSSGSSGGSYSSSLSTPPGISPPGVFKELTWFDEPFSTAKRSQDTKFPDLKSLSTTSSIENELRTPVRRCSISGENSPKNSRGSSPVIPDQGSAMEELTSIEIEARQRYEQRMKRRKERESNKDEVFFF